MSALRDNPPACVTADEVRRIVRDELRSDRERLRQMGDRLDRAYEFITTIKRAMGAFAGSLKE